MRSRCAGPSWEGGQGAGRAAPAHGPAEVLERGDSGGGTHGLSLGSAGRPPAVSRASAPGMTTRCHPCWARRAAFPPCWQKGLAAAGQTDGRTTDGWPSPCALSPGALVIPGSPWGRGALCVWTWVWEAPGVLAGQLAGQGDRGCLSAPQGLGWSPARPAARAWEPEGMEVKGHFSFPFPPSGRYGRHLCGHLGLP